MPRKPVLLILTLLVVIANIYLYFFGFSPALAKGVWAEKGFEGFILSRQGMLTYFSIQAFLVLLLLLLTFVPKDKKEKHSKKRSEKKRESKSMEKTQGGKRIRLPKRQEWMTDIDLFYEVLKQEGKVKAKDIASVFHVSEQKIEEWAEVLEHQGLVEIEKKFSGTEIMLKKQEPDVEAKKPGDRKVKKKEGREAEKAKRAGEGRVLRSEAELVAASKKAREGKTLQGSGVKEKEKREKRAGARKIKKGKR